MAGRIRSLKPELREHAPFATLTDGAARLFVMLYTLVDDEGRCPAGARFIAGAIFFGRPRTPAVVGRLLAELASALLVTLYEVDGSPFLEMVGWREKGAVCHQRIDKPQLARYPAPGAARSANAFADGPGTSDLRPPTSDRDNDRDQGSPQIAQETEETDTANGVLDCFKRLIEKRTGHEFNASKFDIERIEEVVRRDGAAEVRRRFEIALDPARAPFGIHDSTPGIATITSDRWWTECMSARQPKAPASSVLRPIRNDDPPLRRIRNLNDDSERTVKAIG